MKTMYAGGVITSLALLTLPGFSEGSLAREVPREVITPGVVYDAFATRLYDPQGRVLQLEYAVEATRKGGAAAAAALGDYAAIAKWSPRQSKRQIRASRQPVLGIWRCDGHVALAASGMAMDGLLLADFIRRECLGHRYIYDSPLTISRLVKLLAQEMHETERHRLVPYAVDLLVCGVDDGGPAVYNVGLSGVYDAFEAYAVGSRAELANGYLASHLPVARQAPTLRTVIELVLRALLKTIPREAKGPDGSVVSEDISLTVVGRELPLTDIEVEWHHSERRADVFIPTKLAEVLG